MEKVGASDLRCCRNKPLRLWRLVSALWEQLEGYLEQQKEALLLVFPTFALGDKQQTFDLAVFLHDALSIDRLGAVYRIPNDGPAPDAIIEVVGDVAALGEALSLKADFCQEMGVHDYLVVENLPDRPMQLWYGKAVAKERPRTVPEAVLTSLKLLVRPEKERLRLFTLEGEEVLSPRELLAKERARREALEQLVAELSRRVAELGQLLQGQASL